MVFKTSWQSVRRLGLFSFAENKPAVLMCLFFNQICRSEIEFNELPANLIVTDLPDSSLNYETAVKTVHL